MLTVPNAHVSDSGVYYSVASASFTDGTDSTQSNDSIVNITGKYVYMILFQMYVCYCIINLVCVCIFSMLL